MKTQLVQDMLFPLSEKKPSTLIVEIPDLTTEEGRQLIADLMAKFSSKDVKFEVKCLKPISSL